MELYELRAWLGPALDEITARDDSEQLLERLIVEAARIGERYPDPDEQDLWDAAMSATTQYLLGDSTPEDIGRAYTLARIAEARAYAAAYQIASVLVAEDGNESAAARRTGVDRMTVRKIRGKRRPTPASQEDRSWEADPEAHGVKVAPSHMQGRVFSAEEMARFRNRKTKTLQVITDVESTNTFFTQEPGGMVEHTTTTGYIVPAGTALADAQDEAEDTISIPVTEDDWWQGFRDALANAGYAVEGEIRQDGSVVTADVVRI